MPEAALDKRGLGVGGSSVLRHPGEGREPRFVTLIGFISLKTLRETIPAFAGMALSALALNVT
jgi:hypothetical protein